MGERGERIQRLSLCRTILLAEAGTKLRALGALTPPRRALRTPSTVSSPATGTTSTAARAAANAADGSQPAPDPPTAPDGFVASLDLDCRHGPPERLLDAVSRMRGGIALARGAAGPSAPRRCGRC